MQPLTSIRTLALASMLAFSIMSPLAVHAQPNDGGGGADTRPDNASCAFVTAGFYDCTTPDGGEWYCTNATDPAACVQVKAPSIVQSGPIVIVHPVFGGTFAPVSSNSPVPAPQVPLHAVFTLP